MRWARWMTVAVLASVALAADRFESGGGVVLSSGARVDGSLLPAGDTDVFVVAGRAGQRLDVRLRTRLRTKGKKGKKGKSDLQPTLRLIPPGGEPGPVEARGRARLELPESGIWTLVVGGGEDLTSGAYRLDVTLGRPPGARVKATARDETGAFRTEFAAGPGDRVDVRVQAKGAALAEVGVVSPDEDVVAEAAVSRKAARLRETLATSAPVGTYTAFARGDVEDPPTSVRFVVNVSPPKLQGTRRRIRLEDAEPRILAVPGASALGVPLPFFAQNLSDAPTVILGATELDDVVVDGTSVTAFVPASTPPGLHRLHVRTEAGQWASSDEPIAVGPAPRVSTLTPASGPSKGGFEIAITGADLPPADDVLLVISGLAVRPSAVLEAAPTRLRLLAPPHAPGAFVVHVRNARSGLTGNGLGAAITYDPTPRLESASPGLVAELGGDVVTVLGAEFQAGDRLLVETGAEGVFEEIGGTTYIPPSVHRFTAPVRGVGTYSIVIESPLGVRRESDVALTYFSFADATAAAGLTGAFVGDLEAVSTTFVDIDGDGRDDLVLARSGGASAAAASLTRVLRNAGGTFVDVTDDVLPEPPPGDDWRADRVRAADFDGDGRFDLALLTASDLVPPPGRSGLRLLRNVPNSGAPGGRAFEDVTDDRMAPIRMKRSLFEEAGEPADAWRGRDLWIGDLDGDEGDIPEIVVTGAAPFAERYVAPGNYTTFPGGSFYSYSMYWPATRVFAWDAEARSGLGRFRFEFNHLPRRAGVNVFIGGVPPGVYVGTCNNATPCEDTFTPFSGRSLAVADFDGDGWRDIAVVTTEDITRRDHPTATTERITSSLQVALGSATRDPQTGAWMRDITASLEGADVRGTRLAAGVVEPEGAAVLAVSSPDAAARDGLRLLAVNPDLDVDPPVLEDVTDDVLAPLPPGDVGQASALTFADLDRDGRDDLVLLGDESSGGGAAALRILRAASSASAPGWRLVPRYADLIDGVRPGDDLDGGSLAIGDLDGDSGSRGLPVFAITRDVDGGGTPETRLIRMTAE